MKDRAGRTFVFSRTWSDFDGSIAWQNGMVTGNGENAVIASGNPLEEVFIFQNNCFNFPIETERETPDKRHELERARQAVIHMDSQWESQWESRYQYSFHPAHQLRLRFGSNGELKDYYRFTDYETAETGVVYCDDDGKWVRRTFASREDGVVVTHISSSTKGKKLHMTISLDDISSIHRRDANVESFQALRYKKLVDEAGGYIALAAHYPAYENSALKEGGYVGLSRVIAYGGTKKVCYAEKERDPLLAGEAAEPVICIEDAEEVFLISLSDRTFSMGAYEAFGQQKEIALVEELARKTSEVAGNPAYCVQGRLNYANMLMPHARIHGQEYKKVRFSLEGRDREDYALANEELLAKQRKYKERLNYAMVERAYYAGRYAQLCSSGQGTCRLGGIWTGTFMPFWCGHYTLDANVNLQIAPANTGHMKIAARGYMNFILRIACDWEVNAEKIYGMKRALQVPVNTDGDRSSLTEFNKDYPFQYWNAGASWLLLPIFEYWQCYGNERIPLREDIPLDKLRSVLSTGEEKLTEEAVAAIRERGYLDLERELLLPLLTGVASFWEQLADPRYYVDTEGNARYDENHRSLGKGEKYLVIPSYSPENHPIGIYTNCMAANATMDIAAARDALDMAVRIQEAAGGPESQERIARWRKLKEDFCPYQYDETGALREWAMKEYTENHDHRHISHLYPIWPGYEGEQDPQLVRGAKIALTMRNRCNKEYSFEDTASHGWMHKGLVNARLKDGAGVLESLMPTMTNDSYYDSFMTDHNTNRECQVYCTDTAIGTTAVINEALLFSMEGGMELLPALPEDWKKGCVTGLMARTQAELLCLEWDLEEKVVSAKIRSDREQTLRIRMGLDWRTVVLNEDAAKSADDGRDILVPMEAGSIHKLLFML